MATQAQQGGDDLQIQMGVTERRMLQQLARIEASSVKRAKGIENRFTSMNRNVSRGFEQSNRGAQRFAGGGLRQVSMQLSQVAQQGAATGNWVQALSIQLPDLALGFGAVGIAIGAVAGVLAPMAFDMLKLGDATEALDEKMKALADAMSRVESARKDARRGVIELRSEYGALAEQAEKLFEIELKIAEMNAQSAFASAVGDAGEGFGLASALGMDGDSIRESLKAMQEYQAEYQSIIDMINSGGIIEGPPGAASARADELIGMMRDLNDVENEIVDLSESMGITIEQAREFAALLADVSSAEGPEQQAQAMERLADHIWTATDGLAKADENTRAFYERLLAAAKEALRFAAADLSSNTGLAADEAGRLVMNLESAVALAERLARYRTQQNESTVTGFESNDPRARSEGDLNTEFDYGTTSPFDPARVSTSGSSSRGGGSGGAMSEAQKAADQEMNRLLSERDSILRSLETATDEYERELADLNRLMEMGELTSEQYAAAVGKIEEKLVNARFGEVIKGIEDVSRALADAMMTGEKMGEALGDVFRQIAADLIASGLQKMLLSTFMGAFGGGGQIGTPGITAGLFGGGRAAGGPVKAGGLYEVGEHGRELFAPGMDGTILNASKMQQLTSGEGSSGGVNVTFAPVIDARGADAGAVARIEANQRRLVAEFEGRVVETLRRSGNRGVTRNVMRRS